MIGITGQEAFGAPELLYGGHYNEKVDIWSAGIVLYFLLSLGKKIKIFPHDEESEKQAIVDRKIKKLTCSPELNELLRNLLWVNPQLRLTADQALNSVWFLPSHQ